MSELVKPETVKPEIIEDQEYFNLEIDAKRFIDGLKSIVALDIEEIYVSVDSEGLNFKSMDPSHVSMIKLDIRPNNCQVFKLNKNVGFGLNVESLLKMLKIKKDDTLELKLVGKTLRIRVKGQSVANLTIKTLDMEKPDIPEPKLTFNVNLRIEPKKLYEKVKAIRDIGDHLIIESKDSNMISLSSKNDNSENTIGFDMYKHEGDILELDTKESSRAMFNLNYLFDMVKALKPFDVIDLEYSSNMPMRLKAFNQIVETTYYLAPRIESD
jgi:proliferating cell nuclear antigen